MPTCTCGSGPHQRTCDYCGYEWDGAQCIHDGYQVPCPHCDVLPVVQVGAT